MSTITINATCTAPRIKNAIAACALISPGVAASCDSTGTASSSITLPPSTAKSGVSASITSPLSQPVNSPRVPSNSAMTTKIGPSATSSASAIRAVTSTPTVPSSSSVAPIHNRPGGEKAEMLFPCVAVASRTAANTRSIFCANTSVAEPCVPIIRLAR